MIFGLKELHMKQGTRSEAVGFSINDRGFVLTGKGGTYQYDDMWEFFPSEEYDEYD